MKTFQEAIEVWKDVLGPGNVIHQTSALKEVETATFMTDQKVPLIVRPGSVNDVQATLKIANDYDLGIYPLSTGKNWGLGSRVPVADNSVIMDLSRLNKILDYSEELAYVTIEPGVTCRQLYNFLREKKSNLMVSLTGSTPDASIVGNVMERGHSKGVYADRYANICGLEVVLPTGQCIHSGFDRFSDARAAAVNRCGVGPLLDGLFTQSNLGVVTKLTLWLQPFPAIVQGVFFSVIDEAKLPALVETLRQMRLNGVIKSSISLLNDYRVQSELGQYPWQLMNGEAPLSKTALAQLKTKNTGMEAWDGVWNGETALYSMSEAHAAADRTYIEKNLGPFVDQLTFHTETKESVSALLQRALDPESGRLRRDQLSYLECRMLGFLGIPLAGSIPITYWKKKTSLPSLNDLDPDRDGCGIIWCSPTVPFAGDDIKQAASIITEVMANHGFEPNLCLNAITERSVDITAAIIFDREVRGEDQKAISCYNEMLRKLCLAGYIPYRLTVHSMEALLTERDDYKEVLQTIKSALDPKGVLARGRYQ